MQWLLGFFACGPRCGDLPLEPNEAIPWCLGYVGLHYCGFLPAARPFARAELLCALDLPNRYVSAHLRLLEGVTVTLRAPIDGHDGAYYYDWHGLVLVSQGGWIRPHPRSRECLARRWRADPPTPERCWEEIVGAAAAR